LQISHALGALFKINGNISRNKLLKRCNHALHQGQHFTLGSFNFYQLRLHGCNLFALTVDLHLQLIIVFVEAVELSKSLRILGA
jgi:hypothetical protein